MATYRVKVGDGEYEVDAPDEKTAWQWANAEHAKGPQVAPETPALQRGPGYTLQGMKGVGEAALNLGTGMVATPLSGIAGLADVILGNGSDRAANTVRTVQDALTYQPRTKAGEVATNIATLPAQAYGWATSKGADLIRGDTPGGSMRDLFATGLNATADALPALYSLGRMTVLKPERPNLTPQQEVFKDARKEGYTVSPSYMEKGSLSEGLAGRANVEQGASIANADRFRAAAVKELGLPESTKLSTAVINDVLDKAGTAYDQLKRYGGQIRRDQQFTSDVRAIGAEANAILQDFPNAKLAGQKSIQKLQNAIDVNEFNTANAVEYIKKLRSDSRDNFSAYARSGKPESRALASAQLDAANALESLIERNLANAPAQSLVPSWKDPSRFVPMVDNFRDARTMIAKAHSIERVMNPATGNINAMALYKDRGIQPGSPLDTASKFAISFPKNAQMPEFIGGQVPFNMIDVYRMGSPFHLQQLASGNPAGALAGGIPLVRGAAKRVALSDRVQNSLLHDPTPILPLTPGLLTSGLLAQEENR